MTAGLAIAALAIAVALVRFGWRGARGFAVAGWLLAAAALGWLTATDGAWGLATGLSAASVFAVGAVLYSGAVSPSRPARRIVAAPAVRLPQGPSGLQRRVLVFLAVVPLSFLAAQWLAFAINTAMKGSGPLEANSVATMMFVQPVAWAILMSWQMMLPRPGRMMVPPALAAAAGTLIWMIA